MELLRKRRKTDNNEDLSSNTLVKHAIKSCGGLPLAISIISGLNLQSDHDWQNVIKTITNKDLEAEELLADYNFNIFATFQLSVDQSNQRDQDLFRSLAVFEAVNIPLESIISLWGLQNISRHIVTTILKKLHRRSLINFVDVGRLV